MMAIIALTLVGGLIVLIITSIPSLAEGRSDTPRADMSCAAVIVIFLLLLAVGIVVAITGADVEALL